MLAATLADLDGVGFFVSEKAYWDWHHVAGHNVLYAVVMSGVLSAFSGRRWFAVFPVYMALAHVHLVMDYYGSGPGWAIYYLWPFSGWKVRNPEAWELSSWQNVLAFGVLGVWGVVIAVRKGRTPVEVVTPGLDRRAVRWVRGVVYGREEEELGQK
jgi:hypothetical protein